MAAPRPCPVPARCPWCSAAAPRIAVHGHLQCAACGLNTDPCCGGETASDDDAAPPPDREARAAP